MGSRAIGKSWFTTPVTRAAACSRTSTLTYDWIAVLLSTWLLCGVLMDGWAHNHFGALIDSFFTPWHAILYSGFLAVATFHLWTAYQYRRSGCAWRDCMPDGYGLSLLGVLIFGLSGMGDLLWHTLFGIEVSVSAGFSPPHLGLMVGIGLCVSGPLRAAWSRPVTAPRKWMRWLPALLSMHMVLTLMTFVTQYAHPFVVPFPVMYVADDMNHSLGAASILLQSAILMGWILVTLQRWKLPFGSLTLVLTLNALAMCFMRDTFYLIPGAALAGIFADLLHWWLAPAPSRPIQFHIFAFVVPVIYFAFYCAALILTQGILWPLPLWMGSIFMAGITSVLVSYLILPPQRRPVASA